MSANLFSPALAKNLRTAGIWGTLPAVWRRLFTCKYFSRLAKSSLTDVCPNTSFFPSPKIGANSPYIALHCATTPPALQNGTQGQIRRYWRRSCPCWRNKPNPMFFQFFSPSFLKSIFILDTFRYQSLYTTSGSADFWKRRFYLWIFFKLFFLVTTRIHQRFQKFFIPQRHWSAP